MSGGVFICYRREEAGFAARAIHDRIVHRLERENVFLDVDNIDLGVDWFNVLTERVGACDALVAVIGRNWVSSADKDNHRRIDDPDDFVRIEIEAALKRNVRVIPLLVDGAAMPKPAELPDSLKGLARRQGIEISPARFDADVEKLTPALVSILEARRSRDAVEAERVAREDRERKEVAEEAHAEEARRQAATEAARHAEEQRREREAAEAERVTREEVERQQAAEVARAEEAWQKAETARRAEELPQHEAAGTDRRAPPLAADRWKGVAEPEPAVWRGLEVIAAADCGFTPKAFLSGARVAFDMVVHSFAAGDSATLRDMMSTEVFAAFDNAIHARVAAGHTMTTTVVSIDDATIVGARVVGATARIQVRFAAKLVSVTRDVRGTVVDGSPTAVNIHIDSWTFERDIRSRDPNWQLIATAPES
jgi:predicted lipid-binding transport protein (Tim44 family)